MAVPTGFLLVLLVPILCTFTIYKPNDIAARNLDKIPYTIANFGHIPYGKSMIGKLTLSNPSNLCQPDLSLLDNSTMDKRMPYFLFGERKSCKFTTKALNAQKSGAGLAIIEDTNNTESGRIVMANDGFGFQVQIPSIFISYESGEKLKKLIKESNNELIVMVKFDTKRLDNVLFRMWLDANNRQSYVLIRDFKEYHKGLEKHMTSEVFFKVLDTCNYCDESNCLVASPSKKYCYVPTRGSVMTGKEVVEASLRSYFAFQANRDMWWEYMNNFDKSCSMLKSHVSCAEEQLRKLGYSVQDIQMSIQNEKSKAVEGSQDQILKTWADEASKGNILFYPDVTINNINYQGELIASDIFEMVCNSLNKPPFTCDSFVDYETEHTSPSGMGFGTIILYVMLVMTVGFVVVLIIFKKCVRRRMSGQIANQVNQMVSQYVAFYDKNESGIKNTSENM